MSKYLYVCLLSMPILFLGLVTSIENIGISFAIFVGSVLISDAIEKIGKF